MTERRIIADLSDLHCGHRLGLLNPATRLLEGCTEELRGVTLGPTQTRLWRHYNQHLEDTVKIADGDPVTLVFKGDLTHGTKHKEGLAYICLADQLGVAFWCIVPWLERCPNVQQIIIIEGTEAHTHYGSTEPLLALWLRSHFPNVQVIYTGHGLLQLPAVSFDMAHHGGHPGSRSWLHGNSLRYYARDILIQNLMDGKQPPRVISRGHFHEYRHETVRQHARGREWKVDAFLTPSYCGMTGYGRKSTRSMPVEVNGMLVHEVEWHGQHSFKWNFTPLLEKHDLRTVVEIA